VLNRLQSIEVYEYLDDDGYNPNTKIEILQGLRNYLPGDFKSKKYLNEQAIPKIKGDALVAHGGTISRADVRDASASPEETDPDELDLEGIDVINPREPPSRKNWNRQLRRVLEPLPDYPLGQQGTGLDGPAKWFAKRAQDPAVSSFN